MNLQRGGLQSTILITVSEVLLQFKSPGAEEMELRLPGFNSSYVPKMLLFVGVMFNSRTC